MSTEPNNDPMIQEANERAMQIENEISKLVAIRADWTIDELCDESPILHDVIFDAYEDGEENGVVTDNYSMLETEADTQVFNIKSK